jgi:hypothetical protein
MPKPRNTYRALKATPASVRKTNESERIAVGADVMKAGEDQRADDDREGVRERWAPGEHAAREQQQAGHEQNAKQELLIQSCT